jgi:hypothetical protein
LDPAENEPSARYQRMRIESLSYAVTHGRSGSATRTTTCVDKLRVAEQASWR